LLVRKGPLVQRVRQGLPVRRASLEQPDLKAQSALLVLKDPLGLRGPRDQPVPLARLVLMGALC